MTTSKRPTKDPGLIGATPAAAPPPKRHHVPAGVSGVDVSAAVARMPNFGVDEEEEAPGPVPPHTAPPSPAFLRSSSGADGRSAEQSKDLIFKVDVDLLDDSPYQPRRKYDEQALSELGQSLLVVQEEAIIVRPKPNGRWELVTGHRRTRGARMWDIKQLDARLFSRSDAEAAVSALVTNEAREDLSDYERGLAYVALVDAGKNGDGVIKNYEQLAQRLGKSKSLISRRVQLTKLPAYVIAVLDEHPRAVTINNIAELNKALDMKPDQEKLVQTLLRVALGEISMTALTSIIAAQAAGHQAGGNKSQQIISLQAGSAVYAQLVQNTDKRRLTINFPNENIDVDEASKLIAETLATKFGQKGS